MATGTTGTGLDQAAVEAFAEKVLGDYAGANAFLMAGIGERLGLFRELAAGGQATSQELASRTGLQERYLREWLGGMAAAGYLAYDPATTRYALPSDHQPVVAQEAGPFSFDGAFFDFSTNFGDGFYRLLEAFRVGGGVAQQEQGAALAESIEKFTAPWFEHMLVPVWLPAMPDVHAKLEAGASVCDVGCGRGRGVLKLAEAFPHSTFVGYDIYEPAIRHASSKAEETGVADRVRFEVLDAAAGLPGRFDVITTFDVLHDSADPSGILRSIHHALASEGRYVCVDINCSDRPEENVGPMATVMYGASLVYCMTVSLAAGGAGLGTLGLPESRLAALATGVGFSKVRRVPIDDPFNNLYELTP